MARKPAKPGRGPSRRARPRTRTEKRSASTTWRRPRNMPLAVWEEVNQNADREMLEWARGLRIVDEEGHVRELTEEEVIAIAKPGRWAGAARAERKTKEETRKKKEEKRRP